LLLKKLVQDKKRSSLLGLRSYLGYSTGHRYTQIKLDYFEWFEPRKNWICLEQDP